MNIANHTVLKKVPQITVLFWVVKLLTTAMGEATSDFLVAKINPFIAVALATISLGAVLLLQFSVDRYIAWIYWLSAIMVAIFGTMAADGLHVQLGVPYIVSTILFALGLLAVFVAWHKSEGNLSIHSVTTRKREVFYWLTVLMTFALGTAAGDLTANTLGLGFFSSALLFSGLIIIPAVGFWLFRLKEIAAFWAAYILTRPIGASLADWMGKSDRAGGLGWGDGHVSLVLLILISGCIFYITFHRRRPRMNAVT